jgi:hypothetical protein
VQRWGALDWILPSTPNIDSLLAYADSLIEERAEELVALADALAAPRVGDPNEPS